MSVGTLYISPAERTRTKVPQGLVKHFGLDIDISNVEKTDKTFAKNFPLGLYPDFLGKNGFKLTETIAISTYLIKKADPKSSLLSESDEEFASILRWSSFTNADVVGQVSVILPALTGQVPFNKKLVDTAKEKLVKFSQVLEDRLYDFTYLVGERVTLADLIAAQSYFRVLGQIWGKAERQQFPNLVKWFKTIISTDYLKSEFQGFEFPAKALEYVPAKKEKKVAEKKVAEKKVEKKAEKKPEAAPAAEEAPKPKHPLEALPRSKVPLDEWKRHYSNDDTREKAIPWFWENMYNPEEWSLWRLNYKYNDELTLTFMSNNLVGGFFSRLLGSTKYMFGCAVVYGENNNNGITGFLLVRGQDVEPAVNVAPDHESYEFERLDASKEEDKQFINNMLAWDEPVIINGEKKEIVDGKVFK